MPNYKITHRGPALNQKREVRISATGTATPSGFTVLGEVTRVFIYVTETW